MHTILAITRNEAGSELIEEHPEYGARSRDVVEANARYLTAHDLNGAKYRAVLSLRGVNKHTKASDLTIGDIRFLASQVADLPFFDQAPAWAREGVDSVAERRRFTPGYQAHILSCIRAIKQVNQRLLNQVLKAWNDGKKGETVGSFTSRDEIVAALEASR